MRRRFPREVLLTALAVFIYWLLFLGLAFVFGVGCGDEPAPAGCECILIPRRDADNLRASFPSTAAEWMRQCGDGATGWLTPHQLPPGLRLHGRLPPEERWA